MDRGRLPQDTDLYQENGFWKLRYLRNPIDANGVERKDWPEPASVGPATGPMGLTEQEAHRTVWKNLLSFMQQDAVVQKSKMTIAEFVEQRFIPQHIALKRNSCQLYYRALLKYVLTPEEVNRVFSVNNAKSKNKLKTVKGWPYLSDVRLCDVRPEDIQQLISAALARGYSAQTVNHIRNVISAIFTHAKQEHCFVGDNPASAVKLKGIAHKESFSLSPAKTKEALGIMKYPERELMLILIFTGMNVSEICGLQWKQVNLTDSEIELDGTPVPPKTIVVRKQWYRGELEIVKKNRVRNLQIHQPLFEILLSLSERSRFTGPDDFVLVSRTGTPVNETNVLARRLKPIARQLEVPSLSWQVFLRTRKVLESEFGPQFQTFMAMMVRSARVRDSGAQQKWRCRPQLRHPT